jgi:hypothetical protein
MRFSWFLPAFTGAFSYRNASILAAGGFGLRFRSPDESGSTDRDRRRLSPRSASGHATSLALTRTSSRLKPSRGIGAAGPEKRDQRPARRDEPGQAATPPAPPPEERHAGVLFLRADRIDGNEDRITAEGSVELRSRYETVLSDWLNYDIINDEIWAKGNVVIRRGFDWITGRGGRRHGAIPKLVFSRAAPRISSRRRRAKPGAALPAKSNSVAGPDRYDVTDARYTTCSRPTGLVFEKRRARDRQSAQSPRPRGAHRFTSWTCRSVFARGSSFLVVERAQIRCFDAVRSARPACAASKCRRRITQPLRRIRRDD